MQNPAPSPDDIALIRTPSPASLREVVKGAGHVRKTSKDFHPMVAKGTEDVYVKDTPLSLTRRQLGQLLAYVPMVLHWLRDQLDAHVHFLDECPRVQRDAALRRMLDTVNYAGDISIAQWRELGEDHGPAAWASGVRKIVQDSEPRLIPNEIGDLLLKEWESCEDDLEGFGPIVDNLTRTSYYALAEICASFRDTEDDKIFSSVGPMLIGQVNSSPTHAEAATQGLFVFSICHAREENNARNK